MQYYLHDGREQHGPFTLDELRGHSLLKSDTQVWHEGMTDWAKANEIDEIKTLLKSPPPSLVKPPSLAPPPENQAVISKVGSDPAKSDCIDHFIPDLMLQPLPV